MYVRKRLIINTLCLILIIIFIYYYIVVQNSDKSHFHNNAGDKTFNISTSVNNIQKNLNIWSIFTKVTKNTPLQMKFDKLIKSLFVFSSVPLHIHIICDKTSKIIAKKILNENKNISNVNNTYFFYDVKECAEKIADIVEVMTPYFSSQPGTYYSDALFYLSLGLHKIATEDQENAVMLDCDIQFMKDIELLFNQFHNFKESNLFGISYELTPVYRHVLYSYRKDRNTTFGEYVHSEPIYNFGKHRFGFPGFNSGVMLFNFSAIRKSETYQRIISAESVKRLVEKYKFKGHLGDQDFYTILGYEYPELFYILPCNFNRQLCVWWRDHGYSDIFKKYAKCDGEIIAYHGNCNTPIPGN